jgi:integrase
VAKRANNEGSVYRRASDGKYVAALSVRDAETGQLVRTTFYASTRADARRKLREATNRVAEGAPPKDASILVADWLQTWRDTTLEVSARKQSTKDLYRYLIDGHLLTAPIGRRRLDQLRPSDVEALILHLRAKGKQPKQSDARVGRALSDATVQRIFSVLRLALDGAVRDGHIARNPVAAVRQPGVERHEARFLSTPEVGALLGAAAGSRYAPVLSFIAHTGVRKGEALALRWADIDASSRVIRIRSTLTRIDGEWGPTSPKTAKSRRLLPLTPAVHRLLLEVLDDQAAQRDHAGNLWQEGDFVFTSPTGRPLDPRNVLRALSTAAASAAIPNVTVHTLRHSAATAMLEAGIHIKAVSELLGHSDIRITGDVYGHVSTEVARSAMEALSQLIDPQPADDLGRRDLEG